MTALDPVEEARRLLREADDVLSPARRGEALHPIVPIAIASNRIRDALELLSRYDPPAESFLERAARLERRATEPYPALADAWRAVDAASEDAPR